MGIPWICDFLSSWAEFDLGFENSFAIRLCLDIINLTTVNYRISGRVVMSVFAGRVDIHRPGRAAARGEETPGEQQRAEDQAQRHQDHLHHQQDRGGQTSTDDKISLKFICSFI